MGRFATKSPSSTFGLEILCRCGSEAVANDKDGGLSCDSEVLTNIHVQQVVNGK